MCLAQLLQSSLWPILTQSITFRFVSELETTPYLLANQAEWRACLELGRVKMIFEKSIEQAQLWHSYTI